jgi:hypothetical protein
MPGMTETVQGTDKGIGLGFLFSILAVLATLATLGTSYLSVLTEGEGLQIMSGLALAVALLAGGIAIAAFHSFQG